jgi:hypothetical protein
MYCVVHEDNKLCIYYLLLLLPCGAYDLSSLLSPVTARAYL